MRINDSLIGSMLLLLSLAVLWHIQSFPEPIGQPYGAALFPGLIAAGLLIASVALIYQGMGERSVWIMLSTGMRSMRHALSFLAVIASLLSYILLAETIGFLISAILMLVLQLWAFRVRAKLILPIAISMALVVHTCFYKLLKVPLPWGLLKSWTW